MRKPNETNEEKILWLEGEVGLLREAIELLVSNCACTAAERYSGHLVDCTIPAVRELLNPSDTDETDSERNRSRL